VPAFPEETIAKWKERWNRVAPLSPGGAKEALNELLEEMVAQHLRTRLARYLEVEGEIHQKTFQKGTRVVGLDKPLQDLLQEQPQDVRLTVFRGTPEGPAGVRLSGGPTHTLGDITLGESGRLFAVVTGAKAKVYVVHEGDETECHVMWRRYTPPPPPERSTPSRAKRRAAVNRRS